MKTSKIIEEISKRMVSVGAERDKLDDLILDLEGLRDSCDKTWDSLHDARDALSELV